MTIFNEENMVEQMVLDALCGGVTLNRVAEELSGCGGAFKGISRNKNEI